MKAKRVFVISLAAVFLLAVLFSCVFIFSVKSVKARYSVSDNADLTKIESTLNKYVGNNLLFVNLADIEKELEQYPYYKITNLKKNYPNVISLDVEERREIYCIEHKDKVYVLDQDGFVLNSHDKTSFEGVGEDRIELCLNGVEITNIKIGSYMTTNDQTLMLSILEMAKSARLTDCISKIVVTSQTEFKDADFYTDTGVTITITKADVRGVDKINKAFESYDNADDYYKSFDTILVTLLDSGEILVDWTDKD
jgi:cell division septal protein FtsQ